MPTQVAEIVAERARRLGPIPFDEVVDIALYHPEHGFYSTGGGAGRSGDFLTSPEVGPLFGAILANALDQWWRDLGEPDPYVVVEAGAGAGTLARHVLDANPACIAALRYVLVERSERLRDAQHARLPMEPARQVLGPAVVTDPDEGPHPQPGVGPLVTSLTELPQRSFVGAVIANELLDNLPFDLMEKEPLGWAEVRVDDELRETLVPAATDLALHAERLAPDAPPGARIPLQRAAAAWLREALGVLDRGRIAVVDYAGTTPDMARRPWTEWVRTYRGHGPGGHPLEHLGEQDITCEVAVDQLPTPDATRHQADFLRAHGIDGLADDARRAWQDRAHIGDLDALKHRSRVGEATALTDPAGLGAFRVLEWEVGK
ncbi:MAG TPA: SAM-dependent methyltransferase [Acidimicrobiales bacterium]|jgi:SAM-dependent MidA family methyltransferase|nr:SAM-dependent methyltransferase [Acidimicrobiales bacterium]